MRSLKTGLIAGLALAATALSPVIADDEKATENALECDNKPVVMVVSGVTHDRKQMQAYGKAIQDSGIYATLAGYYLNAPIPVAVFEGDVPSNYATLIVRFPCLAHAKAFWYSDVYQNTIKPMRTETNAGEYTVTVYPELPEAGYMSGKVADNAYSVTFGTEATDSIPQAEK